MIVDTSGLLAFLDRNEPDHGAAAAVIDASPGRFVVSQFVLAELDYLVLSRHGVKAEIAMLETLTDGAWQIESLTRDETGAAIQVVKRYHDLNIGLTDAANVVLAHRCRTPTILTLDHAHFDVLGQLNGAPFEVLPPWAG